MKQLLSLASVAGALLASTPLLAAPVIIDDAVFTNIQSIAYGADGGLSFSGTGTGNKGISAAVPGGEEVNTNNQTTLSFGSFKTDSPNAQNCGKLLLFVASNPGWKIQLSAGRTQSTAYLDATFCTISRVQAQ